MAVDRLLSCKEIKALCWQELTSTRIPQIPRLKVDPTWLKKEHSLGRSLSTTPIFKLRI